MDIHNYDDEFAFTITTQAQPNPREVGEFLIPAKATTIAPPSIPAGQCAIFNEQLQTWSLTEDHRGLVWDIRQRSWIPYLVVGPLPQSPFEYATSEPPSILHEWDGVSWTIPPLKQLKISRRLKIIETSNFGVQRINAHLPAINNLDQVELIKTLWSTLNNPGSVPELAASRDIYIYASNKIAEIKTMDQATVDAYDPATDPSFPS